MELQARGTGPSAAPSGTLAQFDEDNENIRVSEIGVILNDLGGHVLMAKVATNVVNTLGLGSIVEREFDAVWDGIGTWRF